MYFIFRKNVSILAESATTAIFCEPPSSIPEKKIPITKTIRKHGSKKVVAITFGSLLSRIHSLIIILIIFTPLFSC